jgi:hypothetical protein
MLQKKNSPPSVKRNIRLITGLLGFLAVIFVIWLLFSSHSITIEQYAIQDIIDEKLPEVGHIEGKKLLVNYVADIHEVTLDLRESNEAMIHASSSGNINDRPFSLIFSVTGEPVYREGAFYFRPTRNVDVQHFSLNSRGEGAETDLVSTAIGMVSKLSGKTEKGIENMAVDIIRDKLAASTLPRLLAKIPLFNLESLGTKGTIAKLTLDQVVVGDGSLTITFSMLQLTLKVILIIAAIVAVVGLAIACPDCFMIFAVFSSWN